LWLEVDMTTTYRWILGCVLLLACGGGSDDPTPGGGDELTLGEMCQAVAQASCDKITQCAPPAPAGCVSTFMSACCPDTAACAETIPDSSADALEACLDEFAALSCTAAGSGVSLGDCD
jgi:hypothetical protein